MTVRHPLVTLVVALLAACGGGGGDAPGPLPSFDTSAVAAADAGSTLPDGWQHGAFAEIYVRGYKDSDGDGIGDLPGLIGQLDYLKDLGIRGIWLMPVTKSQDHDHGYAVTDYRDIEAQYGKLGDFKALLAAAHLRGIGVVIDYVMNHSAYQHPAFTNSRAAADNAYRSWYVWATGWTSGWDIYGQNPWRSSSTGSYFAVFWDQMPDFNLRNPTVVGWHQDNLRYWLNLGVDGFRFDAVGNLVENGPAAWNNQPESVALMGDVHTLLGGYAKRWMVCEAPSAVEAFAADTSCGSAFAFGHNYDIVNAAMGQSAAVAAVASYFNTASANVSTMVSNHDSFAGDRLWDQLNCSKVSCSAQYKLAAATYVLQPGTPFIYYGEEIGMAGAATLSGDWKLRTPMSWTGDTAGAGFTTGTPFRALSANVAANNVAAQTADPNSLLAFYKTMIGLRNARPSLARGSYEVATANGTVMSFQRALGAERTLVVVNYGAAAATAAVTGIPANATLVAAYPDGAANLAANASGQVSVSIDAQSVRVYAIRP